MEKIESVNNEKIKLAVKVASSSAKRKELGLFFLEGLRLCKDVLQSNVKIKTAFFSEDFFDKYPQTVDLLCERSESAFLISSPCKDKLSFTENSQGIYLLCEKLGVLSEKDIDPMGKYIIMENVRDPANLGAICRTAEALGVSGAIVYGCCDRFSPKAQRAAMGSLLRFPVFESVNLKDTLLFLKACGMKIYATTPDSRAKKITDLEFSKGTAAVIGNEANGITEEIFDICEKITIPMLGRAESLNASMAASITMWEMMRSDG